MRYMYDVSQFPNMYLGSIPQDVSRARADRPARRTTRTTHGSKTGVKSTTRLTSHHAPGCRAPPTEHRARSTVTVPPIARPAAKRDRSRTRSGRTTATTRWAGCRAESTPTCASVNHKAGTDLLHSTQTATTTSRGHLSSTRTEAQSRPHATRRVQLLHAH